MLMHIALCNYYYCQNRHEKKKIDLEQKLYTLYSTRNNRDRRSIMKIRVLIADDHGTFRRALRRLLEMDPDIEVSGEAGSGQEACSLAMESHADVVCMDFRMADMDGIESTRRLVAAMPSIKIIGMSASFEASTESAMLAAGASMYIAKANACDDLVPAIRAMFLLDNSVEDSLGSIGEAI